MTQQAAIDLDVGLTVLSADPADPAVEAGATHLEGDPSDLEALRQLAERCDVVSFEHELVPNEALVSLAEEYDAVRPSPAAKLLAQDKWYSRQALEQAGFPLPAFAHAASAEEACAFAERHGWPVVLKAPTGGYDGRGVWFADNPDAVAVAFGEAGGPLLCEENVKIDSELAAITARRPSGEVRTYPIVETLQVDGICHEVALPASVDADLAAQAVELVERVASQFEVEGLVCIELFNAGGELLVNELALRPHNSGHVTMDACETSQFENFLRAILDLPLGDTRALHPAALMVNVLGPADGSDPRERLGQALAVEGARVHLYGKEPRPGRKLGHVNAVGDDADSVAAAARRAANTLSP